MEDTSLYGVKAKHYRLINDYIINADNDTSLNYTEIRTYQ